MNKYILILISFTLTTLSQTMFQPFNLDFELGEQNGLPVGFELSRSTEQFGYQVGISKGGSINGINHLTIFNYSAYGNQSGTVFQSVDGAAFHGRKIRLKAFVKLESYSDSSFAELYIHEYVNGKSNNFVRMIDNPIKSNIWTEYQIEIDISENAEKVNFGLILNGSGTAFIDYIRFEYLDEVIATSGLSLSNNNLRDLVKYGKIWSYLRYFIPTNQSINANHEALLYNFVNNLVNTENRAEDLFKKVFEPIYPYYFNQDLDNSKIDKDIYLTYKHIGAPNFGQENFSSTEIKNVYNTDRPREAAVFQRIAIDDVVADSFEIKCKVICDAYNTTGNAQIWAKLDKKVGNEIQITSFDNYVKSKDWVDYRISGLVPENAIRLTVGLIMLGEGETYFDDLQINLFNENEMIKVFSPNNSFEIEKGGLPDDWTVPESVIQSGYEVSISSDKSSLGEKSLMIKSDDSRIYNYPEPGQMIESLNFPLGVHTSNGSTFPNPNNKYLNDSKKLNPNDDISKVCIALEAMAVYDLFFDTDFKYYDDFKVFQKTINSFIKSNNKKDIIKNLDLIFSKSNDKTYRSWFTVNEIYSVPFLVEFFTDGAFISSIHPDEKEIKLGDKVKSIDGKDPKNLVGNLSTRFELNKAMSNYLSGANGEEVEIKVIRNNNELSFNRKKEFLFENILAPKNEIRADISQNTYYIDMAYLNNKELKKFMENYSGELDALIFDARGNTNLSEYFLGYFIDETITDIEYNIPVYVQPESVSYKKIKTNIMPLESNFEGDVYFLIDANTSGYTESIIAIAKENNIGKIIGTPSLGFPGDNAALRLIGGLNISKNVTKLFLNGRLQNGTPVKPDFLVEQDSSNIDPLNDNLVNKALELINK